MAYEVPSFLKRNGDQLLFNQDGEFVFYVPETYFLTKNAVIVGDYVNILGILDYAIFDKNGKPGKLMPFSYPSVFLTKPYTIDKQKDIKLTANSDVQDYRLFRYAKGDQIVVSVKTPQDIKYVEDYFRLLFGGHIPNTVNYTRYVEDIQRGIALNGASYKLNWQVFGIMISELLRDREDMSKPFRNSGSKDMTAYRPINIRQVPKVVSPYAAIASENWDEDIVSALLMKSARYDSPTERLMMN